MLKVFADQHHFGLYNSLKMLFEDRLHGTLYRPIGREWLDQGFWRIAEIYNNHPFTVAQYLGIHDDYVSNDGVYDIWENGHKFYQHAITLERFWREPIDIVVATVPEHIASFKKLCELHPNHPKMIYQIGNAWPVEAGLAPNIMASAKIENVPAGINFIEYHQEFDTTIFSPFSKIVTEAEQLTFPAKNIYSFINCLNTANIYKWDWPLFEALERDMPEWTWRTYGGSCRDGECNGQKEVADKMRDARFIWHVKAGGDGYGHVLHNALAVGRPLIVKKDYYRGKMAEPLLLDGETCIAIDGLSCPQIINKIVDNSTPERYAYMSRRAFEVFNQYVNFDAEQKRIEDFLGKLI